MLKQRSDSIEQFSAPIPTSPIGVGAKWKVASTITLSGIQLTQTTHYELVALEKGIATLNLNVTQQAAPQAISLPNMPANLNFQLKSLNSTGQGQIQLAFDLILPLNSTLSMQSNSEMKTTNPSGGQTLILGNNSRIDMKLTSK